MRRRGPAACPTPTAIAATGEPLARACQPWLELRRGAKRNPPSHERERRATSTQPAYSQAWRAVVKLPARAAAVTATTTIGVAARSAVSPTHLLEAITAIHGFVATRLEGNARLTPAGECRSRRTSRGARRHHPTVRPCGPDGTPGSVMACSSSRDWRRIPFAGREQEFTPASAQRSV